MKKSILTMALIIVSVVCSLMLSSFTKNETERESSHILANAKTIDNCFDSGKVIGVDSASEFVIIYDGPAYSPADNDMIPQCGESVNIYWTDEGCSVNGNSGYQPYHITGGGFLMRLNGKSKYMNYFVNYKGNRYYFEI